MTRIIFSAILFFCFSNVIFAVDKPATVIIKKEKGRYQLYRNGQPYFIKGAGGYDHYNKIKAYGGNSVRIWSLSGARQAMDRAHKLGLTVTLGLDLGQERQGFSYSDKKAVKEQFERIKKDVLAFKDHPALLMWGIGNEVEQFSQNYDVWDAVNEIAKFIHTVDPKHPTTTMVAGVPRKHIGEMAQRCPALDVLSINIFSLIVTVQQDITEAGWTGPFMIGEWGAAGYWESPPVPWGTFVEETSTQKAEACEERYRKGILQNSARCLGGYAFYWGWKQARTHTLLSLFSEDSLEYGSVDVIFKLWSGKKRSNTAPVVTPLLVDKQTAEKGLYMKPGSAHKVMVDAKDPENDALIYNWEIYAESRETKEGGDEEMKPHVVGHIDQNSNSISFVAPKETGAYRIFVYVRDGKGHIASANFPFYVKR